MNQFRRARAFLRFAARQRDSAAPEPSPDRVALVAALATLPSRLRRVIVMYHLGDLSVAEISHREGIPEGTVKSWLHRGRAMLADRLGGTGGADV